MKQSSVRTTGDGTRIMHRGTVNNLWKPTFRLTREEIYDADHRKSNDGGNLTRSHQTSTLNLPEDSPHILAMPNHLPTYVMPRIDSIRDAHLVRRSMEYTETCEYRLNEDNTTLARTNLRNSDLASFTSARQGLQIHEDDRESTTSSRLSMQSRRSSVLSIPASDRVLRPRPGRKSDFSGITTRVPEQQNTNSWNEEDEDYLVNFHRTPVLSQSSAHYPSDLLTTSALRSSWLVPNLYGMGSEVSESNQTITLDHNTSNSPVTRSRHVERPNISSNYSSVHSTTYISPNRSTISRFIRRLTNKIYLFLSILVACFLVVGYFLKSFFAYTWSMIKRIFSYYPKPTSVPYRRTTSMNVPNKSMLCASKRCCLLSLLPLILLLVLAVFLLRPLEDKHTSFLGDYLPSDAVCFHDDSLRLMAKSIRQRAAFRWYFLTKRVHTIIYPLYLSFLSQITWAPSESVLLPPIQDVKTLEDLRAQLYLHHTALENEINNISTRLKDVRAQAEAISNSVAILTNQHQRITSVQQQAGLTDSILKDSLSNLRLQITTLEQVVNSDTGGFRDQQLQAIIDTLVKQALFVSTASLETRLSGLKIELESFVNNSEHVEEFKRFAENLEKLHQLIDTHRSDLDSKLQQAKRDFEAHRQSMEAVLIGSSADSTSSESQKELLRQAQTFAKSGIERLDSQIEALTSRLNSMEELNANLDENFKKYSLQLSKDEEKKYEELENSQSSKIASALGAFKDIFSDELSSSLRQKIIDELKSRDSKSDLQLSIFSLIKSTVDEKLKTVFKDVPASLGGNLVEQVRGYLDASLDLLMTDKTGRADFALRSAGGSVVSTRCTKTFTDGALGLSFFGFHFNFLSDRPQRILEPSVHPGECWCFHGSEGQVIVKLAVPTHVTGVSLEHIPKVLTFTGKIDSAPREFIIKSLDSETAADGLLLGSFIYDEDGSPIQYFPITVQTDKPVSYIELAISSNHGHPEYTCVYRFRVHGTGADDK